MPDGDGTGTEVQPKPDKPELAERVGAIEAEQQRQGGILERIEQALAGNPKATGTSSDTTTDTPGGLSVAEQVRKGVEEIEARKAAEAEAKAKADAESAWRASIESRLPERRPSEPATGRKAKLQERMFGKADAR